MPPNTALPAISQKSLFLALYAKVLAGEKLRDEDSEMMMGPRDVGTNFNKQLVTVSRFLQRWFAERETDDDALPDSQGFLAYLYEPSPLPPSHLVELMLM